jgi:subtilisin family serine protease
MGAGDYGISVTIPATFVGYASGMALADWYALHPEEAALQLDTIAIQRGNTPDQVAGFSSRGPAVGDRLKPDIAAPGVNVLAQGYGRGVGEVRHLGFGQVGGTSMASPHVAGAAALLKQAHPEWSNEWIKSALMSTAKYTDIYALGGAPAQPLDMGAGRLDLTRAADPGVILNPPSLSFGRVVTGTDPVIKVMVTSVSDEEEQYQLSSVYTGESFTDTMPVPGLGVNWRSITLQPGETKEIEVTWSTSHAITSFSPERIIRPICRRGCASRRSGQTRRSSSSTTTAAAS